MLILRDTIDDAPTPMLRRNRLWHSDDVNDSCRSRRDLYNLQRSRQLLLPPPLFLHLQKLRIPTPLVVDATLGLRPTLPPSTPLILALANRLRRMPIPNTLIPAIQEFVVWQ